VCWKVVWIGLHVWLGQKFGKHLLVLGQIEFCTKSPLRPTAAFRFLFPEALMPHKSMHLVGIKSLQIRIIQMHFVTKFNALQHFVIKLFGGVRWFV